MSAGKKMCLHEKVKVTVIRIHPFVGVSVLFCLYSTGFEDMFSLRPVLCDIADIMSFKGSTR